METYINSKKEYQSPVINLILLDNEISLALQSTPPPAPGEPGYTGSLAPEFLNNDPFKATYS